MAFSLLISGLLIQLPPSTQFAFSLEPHFSQKHQIGSKEKETGRKPGPLEFYIASHKRKDGSFKEDFASKGFVDIAEAWIAERMTDGASAKDVEDEVFHELMYESQSDQDKKYQQMVMGWD